ncbi:MAG TPA: 23S rRNA (uracil(1939)-C(5))-methyltransferase RlmD [Burkholderiaceae bacterium]|nr:23S rRNA (uracil(1939)-C(5))-methyltransferase RlmD [Burkholderiaceae bacterium]
MAGNAEPVTALRVDWVESLDQQGRGIVRVDGKAAFIEGALPGERVRWERLRSGQKFDVGRLVQVEHASSQRVSPRCPHFGLWRGACGGCSMQHLDARAQVAVKQRVLEDALWHLARLKPEQIMRPISGVEWGYRHRARLSVRYVARKAQALVGFHERASSFVADMRECHVLAGPVGSLLMPLRSLVSGMDARRRLPQIEVAVVQAGSNVHTVLVFRILDPLSASDRNALERFGAEHQVAVWLQPSGPGTAAPLADSDAVELQLRLPEFGVQLPFAPTDFTQVNHAVNENLVRRALARLDGRPDERALDLFCGLGNFTLPLATRVAHVIGIEGNQAQVTRAARAAEANGLQARVRFVSQDLFAWTRNEWESLNLREGRIDRVLLDPPREGALAVARALAASQVRPRCLVYVSCNPATLARDCAVLVHEGHWRLAAAGIVNMFPHTSHVESLAVLQPENDEQ